MSGSNPALGRRLYCVRNPRLEFVGAQAEGRSQISNRPRPADTQPDEIEFHSGAPIDEPAPEPEFHLEPLPARTPGTRNARLDGRERQRAARRICFVIRRSRAAAQGPTEKVLKIPPGEIQRSRSGGHSTRPCRVGPPFKSRRVRGASPGPACAFPIRWPSAAHALTKSSATIRQRSPISRHSTTNRSLPAS